MFIGIGALGTVGGVAKGGFPMFLAVQLVFSLRGIFLFVTLS
jgi:hypothetical protein